MTPDDLHVQGKHRAGIKVRIVVVSDRGTTNVVPRSRTDSPWQLPSCIRSTWHGNHSTGDEAATGSPSRQLFRQQYNRADFSAACYRGLAAVHIPPL